MYDNNSSTVAHTIDMKPDDYITANLFIPMRVHSVIFIFRKGSNVEYLMRLNNAKVTLININDEAIICGYTVVVQLVASEIIQVRWQDTSFAIKQIVITIDPSQTSLNIAELRFCFIPFSKLDLFNFKVLLIAI